MSVPSNVEDLRRELARGLDELDAETARLDALPRSKYRTSQHCWKLIGRWPRTAARGAVAVHKRRATP